MKRLMLLVAAIAALFTVRAPILAGEQAPDNAAPKAESPADSAKEGPRNPKAELPAQPKTGPGSSEYAHKEVVVENRGEKGKEYWLYTPDAPKAAKAPVIVLLHGYGAMQPTAYIEWIEHLCKRGNIVIYPRYQATLFEPPVNFASNTASAALDALTWLEADKTRTQPIREKFAIAGHSAGAATTANVAARYDELKLPKPLAIMPVQPGVAMGYDDQANGLIPLADFSKIPKGCLLACVYSDSDEVVGDYISRQVFIESTSVAAADKNLIEVRSDLYGAKAAVATHSTPGAPKGTPDLFDWYGYWKLFDGLCDAAFYGKNRDYALGDSANQRFMGKFSDGHAVRELKVTLGDCKCELTSDYCPCYARSGAKFEKPKPAPKTPPETPKNPPSENPKAPAPGKDTEEKSGKSEG